jgi:hypothetical protein
MYCRILGVYIISSFALKSDFINIFYIALFQIFLIQIHTKSDCTVLKEIITVAFCILAKTTKTVTTVR